MKVVIRFKKENGEPIVNYVVTRKGNFLKFEKFTTTRKSIYRTKATAPHPPNVNFGAVLLLHK